MSADGPVGCRDVETRSRSFSQIMGGLLDKDGVATLTSIIRQVHRWLAHQIPSVTGQKQTFFQEHGCCLARIDAPANLGTETFRQDEVLDSSIHLAAKAHTVDAGRRACVQILKTTCAMLFDKE